MKYFTGIGSRRTPSKYIPIINEISSFLSNEYILRSGHADGSDMFWEDGYKGVNGNVEIYIPWKGFNGSKSELYEQSEEARYIASQYHPNWKNLKESHKKLMSRNVHQVLGKDLNTPSDFIICWTPDGCTTKQGRTKETGGTGQAIAIASDKNIPIINMGEMFWAQNFNRILNEL